MSIWRDCNGEEQYRLLNLSAWRVVEAQHISSTRDLVDSREEHELLEDLLEESKPAVQAQHHYLLFTPFRYPPLKQGSRFGCIYEPALWYGSIELSTALAEVAYHRLKFFEDSTADLGYIEIPMTAFNAFVYTKKGIDLTLPPFADYQDKISDKHSYGFSQPLGAEMRKAAIEAFLFISARAKKSAKNVAAFTPDVFKKKKSEYISNQQNWRCLASKATIEFTRYDCISHKTSVFSQLDFI